MKTKIMLMLTLLASSAHAGEHRVAALPAWTLFDDEHFRAEPDAKVTNNGKPSIRLESTDNVGQRAVLAQMVDAAQYRGKRVRFSAQVKTKSVLPETALWLRIDGASTDSALVSPIVQSGSRDWRELNIVVDVPDNARQIFLGMRQIGSGSSWFNDFSLAVVSDQTPLAATAIDDGGVREFYNGDFESGDASPWFSVGRGDYRVNIVSREKHSGAYSLNFTGDSAQSARVGLIRWVSPAKYSGKRVRVFLWLKQLGVLHEGDFWVRVQEQSSHGRGGENTLQGLNATQEWHVIERVFDVPKDSQYIEIGIGMLGAGDIWIDDLSFEVVSANTPVTPPTIKGSPNYFPFELNSGIHFQ